jgi:tetratricopeptide (TPR) repeat protein
LGNLHQYEIEDFEASLRYYRKVIEMEEKLAAAKPLSHFHAFNLGGVYCNTGHLTRTMGDALGSLAWYAKSIDSLHQALRQNPQHASARVFLRNAHAGRARSLLVLERYPEAMADWDRVLELETGADRPGYIIQRARTRELMGAHREGTSEVDELIQPSDASAEIVYEASRIYSLACRAAQMDSHLGDNERRKLADTYATRSFELLSRARNSGYFKNEKQVKDFKADPDFQSLRDDQRFAPFAKLLDETAAELFAPLP